MSLFWALLRRLFQPYTWGLAWRDSRGQRRRLLLYLSSIAVGVAALVSLQAFSMSCMRCCDVSASVQRILSSAYETICTFATSFTRHVQVAMMAHNISMLMLQPCKIPCERLVGSLEKVLASANHVVVLL